MFLAIWKGPEKEYTFHHLFFAPVYDYAKAREAEGHKVDLFETYGRYGKGKISAEDADYLRRKA